MSEKYVVRNGQKVVKYPIYLEGKMLPVGVESPSSYFSGSFILYLIKGVDRSDSLRNYILSTEIIKDAVIIDVSGMIASDICGQFLWAYEAVFGEYVMSSYNLKIYENLSDRKRVFNDLATYYGNLAFRSSAEALFVYKDILTSVQRFEISEYFAGKVFEYILSCSEKKFVEYIKLKHQDRIKQHCSHYLLRGRYEKKFRDAMQKKISKEEYLHFADSIKGAVRSGRERCLND